MQTRYVILFDVARAGYRHWWFPAFGLIFVVLGLLWLYAARSRSGAKTRGGARFFTGFALLWVVVTFFTTFRDYRALRESLIEGKYQVVEGTISDFVSLPKIEKFRVGSHHYEYSDFEVTASFNNMQSHGGPLRPGLQVRIADVGGRIARLEVAK